MRLPIFFLLLSFFISSQTAFAAVKPELNAVEILPGEGIAKAENHPEGANGLMAERNQLAPQGPISQSAAAHAAGAPDEMSTVQKTEPSTTDNRPQTDRAAAAAIISGAHLPGIIEHQLIRTDRKNKPEINISYPSLGQKAIDADIRQWVTNIADTFDNTVSSPTFFSLSHPVTLELQGSYSVTQPSPNAISVTFEVWTYTGGAHGNLDIITLNYNLLNGQRLGLVDIFEDLDAALAIMSTWSHKVLSQRLGGMHQEQMLQSGLDTVPENFTSLTLTPSGICINFQPYQVAPWAAGAQKVDIPLEELLPARPLLVLWGK